MEHIPKKYPLKPNSNFSSLQSPKLRYSVPSLNLPADQFAEAQIDSQKQDSFCSTVKNKVTKEKNLVVSHKAVRTKTKTDGNFNQNRMTDSLKFSNPQHFI